MSTADEPLDEQAEDVEYATDPKPDGDVTVEDDGLSAKTVVDGTLDAVDDKRYDARDAPVDLETLRLARKECNNLSAEEKKRIQAAFWDVVDAYEDTEKSNLYVYDTVLDMKEGTYYKRKRNWKDPRPLDDGNETDDGQPLKCPECDYEWRYTGNQDKWATCPMCNSAVRMGDGETDDETTVETYTAAEAFEMADPGPVEEDTVAVELPTDAVFTLLRNSSVDEDTARELFDAVAEGNRQEVME